MYINSFYEVLALQFFLFLALDILGKKKKSLLKKLSSFVLNRCLIFVNHWIIISLKKTNHINYFTC
jgi:hypothetical protein